MPTALYNQSVSADHSVPVGQSPGGEPFTVKVVAGATVYYADNWQVSAGSNQGQLTAGQSASFTIPQWLRSASQSDVLLTVGDPVIAASELPVLPPVDICAAFGVSTSLADNSGPITEALTTLGPLGQTAYISKPGAYTTLNPIVIGNGADPANSNWSGKLLGPGGFNATSSAGLAKYGAFINYVGAAGAPAVVEILGPVSGWGIANLTLQGGATNLTSPLANTCILNKAGLWGEARNLRLVGAGTMLHLQSGNSNLWQNILGNWGATTGGGPMPGGMWGGIWMESDGISDSFFEDFQNISLTSPNSSGGFTHAFLYFGACDNNKLRNVRQVRQGTDTLYSAVYDYSVNTTWPSDVHIDNVDFATAAAGTFLNVGTPSAFAGPNRITKISRGNGSGAPPPNPNLANLRYEVPIGAVTVTVPATGVAVASAIYDRTFYVTAGTGGCTMAIQNGPSIVIPAATLGTVRVPAEKTVTPTYTNAPTWVVEGEAS